MATVDLPLESDMLRFGRSLAAGIELPCVIYLHGPLGAGKTTLVRGVLTALGHSGPVKSPTYTLVEPYQLPGGRCDHFDLYRLADPEELEAIGIRDYAGAGGLCLIEWPERGAGFLPAADLVLDIQYREAGGRRLSLADASDRGRRWFGRAEKQYR